MFHYQGGNMKSHKDLDVWKAAIKAARSIYLLTASFPNEERFGMTMQMRRASVSIASNIAEGAARQSDKEFVQFLYIAQGSAAELETQLIIAGEVALANVADIEALILELAHVRQLLVGLIRSIKTA